MSKARNTLSTPSIYIRKTFSSDSSAFRMEYPSSIKQLRSIIRTIFPKDKTPPIIFDDKGEKIKSIDAILPGSTIFVSFDQNDQEETINRPLESSKTRIEQESNEIHNKVSYEKIFGRIPICNVVSNPNHHDSAYIEQCDDVFEAEEEKYEAILTKKPPRKSILKKVVHKIPIRKKKPQFILPEKETQTAKKENELVIQASHESFDVDEHLSDIDQYIKDFDEVGFESNTWEETDQSNQLCVGKSFVDSNDVISTEKCSVLSEPINEFATENDILVSDQNSECIARSVTFFELLGDSVVTSSESELSKLENYENYHSSHWHRLLQEQKKANGYVEINESLLFLDQMRLKARESISEGVFIFQGNYSITIRSMIVGPSLSGKSTLLSLYLDEILINLISSGLWKKSAVFVLSVDSLLLNLYDPSKFYSYIINQVFEGLNISLPYIKMVLNLIKETFLSVIMSRNPPLIPKSITSNFNYHRYSNELQLILNRLSVMWLNGVSFRSWMEYILTLPRIISSIFGLSLIIPVLDDVDKCWMKCYPNEQFSSDNGFYLLEVLFETLLNGNFVLGCKNESVLLQFIGPTSRTNKLSTLSIIKEKAENHPQFLLKFEGETRPFILTIEHFGGSPSYYRWWESLCILSTSYDETDEGVSKEEILEDLLVITQEVIKNIFDFKTNFVLESVKRR